MTNIVGLKRKPKPLRKTYSPGTPYAVQRIDHDDGEIAYEVMDERPDSYRRVCFVSDDLGRNGYAKHDAEQVARGLNLLVQYGMEALPAVSNDD